MDIKRKSKVDTGFSMSSMTDLVFLLLIFFIILSTLVSPYALPVNLPNSSNKTKLKPKVSVTITEDLKFYVSEKEVSPENLESALLALIAPDDLEKSIVLHVDKSVPTGEMIRVLDVAKSNDWKIVLATQNAK